MNNDPLNMDDQFTLIIGYGTHRHQFDDIEVGSEATTDRPIPSEVPILPLRGLVVYPLTAIPLTIGQPRSIKLVDDIALTDHMVGLVTAKAPELENPGPEDLYQIGTVGFVHRFFRAPDGTIRLLVQGLARVKLGEFTQIEPYLKAKETPLPEVKEKNIEIDALANNCRSQFEHIADMIPSIPRELVSSVLAIQDPLQSVYNVANLQRMALSDAQEILEMDTVHEKLHKLLGLLTREAEVLELGQKIQNEARSEIEKIQRDYFLHEQMKAIKKSWAKMMSNAAEVESIRKKLDEAHPTLRLWSKPMRIGATQSFTPAAAEYGVIRY
jgi:ATP-dependent Lon protease